MASTIKLTTSAVIYSYLAWPNGCFSSALFPDILNPNTVTTLLPASDKLFTASATIEMLPDIMPKTAFSAHSKRFDKMPHTPAVSP